MPAASGSSSVAGQTLELKVERLADDGRGLGFHRGKTIFIDAALEGEQVLVNIDRQSAKYSEARVKQCLSRSDERIEPECAVFARCGGCSVQHMSPEKQLAFKERAVLSQLSRWAETKPDEMLASLSDEAYGYRQRVRLSVDYDKTGAVFMGFRESTSQRLVSIKQCPVIKPRLQALIAPLWQWLEGLKPKIIGHIELIHTQTQLAVVVRYTRALGVEQREGLASLLKESKALLWFQGSKGGRLEEVSGRPVDPCLYYYLDMALLGRDKPIELGFHPQDFVQSNAEINQKMVHQALELLAPKPHEHILDLFCGIGNFSLPLALQAKFVTAIEGVESMVLRAQANAQNNGLDNLAFMAGDLSGERLDIDAIVNNARFEAPMPIDGLLLDPPRAGAKQICENILKLSPKRIVYVSCDSSTFARDSAILVQHGYALTKLGLMDMFPQTSHIELMALFTRVEGKIIKSRAKKQKAVGLKLR